jgi:hypothetical protein
MSQVAVQTAYERLEALMKLHHRGPRDTWGAARDRAAKSAGIEPTYAKRLWNRWQTMKDVSGGVFLALQEAYDKQCIHNEAMTALHRQRAEEIRHGGQTDQDSTAKVRRVA